MEKLDSSQEYAHLITPEERAELSRLLGAHGLVDALLFDSPETAVRSEQKWSVGLVCEPNSNCELGYN